MIDAARLTMALDAREDDYVVFERMDNPDAPIAEQVGWHVSFPVKDWKALGRPHEITVEVGVACR